METVDQIIFRYDQRNRAFRPVLGTLADAELASLSNDFTALVDAAYRREDAGAGPSLSFARVPHDPANRRMIICRYPDSTGRLSAAAHVLVGPKLSVQTALGLSVDWPGWQLAAELPPRLEPLALEELNAAATAGLRRAQKVARQPEVQGELARLVDALLRAGGDPLAVVNNSCHPVVLLTAARAILGTAASPDWTFSTGEPAQKEGVRVAFLLPGGRFTSGTYADLSAYDPRSGYLETAHVLVNAYRRYSDTRLWVEDQEAAGVRDLGGLLAWAGEGTRSASMSRAVQKERDRVVAQWAADETRLRSQVATLEGEGDRLRGELTNARNDANQQRDAHEKVVTNHNALVKSYNALLTENNKAQAMLAARQGDLDDLRQRLAQTAPAASFGDTQESPAPPLGAYQFLLDLGCPQAATAFHQMNKPAVGDQRAELAAQQRDLSARLRTDLCAELAAARWDAVRGADTAAAAAEVLDCAFDGASPEAEWHLCTLILILLRQVGIARSSSVNQLYRELTRKARELNWDDTYRYAAQWHFHLSIWARTGAKPPRTLGPVPVGPPVPEEYGPDTAGRLLVAFAAAVFFLIVIAAMFSELR